MNILITAIGSMSGECAIRMLKKSSHRVVGCDIYPREWLAEARLCERFYQAPPARDGHQYIAFLLQVCSENGITHLIPLTDIEIDVIDRQRDAFGPLGVVLCMPSTAVLKIARHKYRLYRAFKDDVRVPSIRTCLSGTAEIDDLSFPCIAKPVDGRSSEGLYRLNDREELAIIRNKGDYILQELKPGPVYTVDYIRCDRTGRDFAVAREELLRTKNGAGLTVRLTNEPELCRLAAHIGRRLTVNGCINLEFIRCGADYYLIDINPRFSAGLAFSAVAGYDMANNHLNCFTGRDIDPGTEVEGRIVTKRYQEEILCKI